MSRHVRLIIIGAGQAGRHHARAAQYVPEIELAGFYDIDPSRAESLALDFRNSAFSDLASAFCRNSAHATPSAALICTPPATHASLARMALESGFHVLVEKPFSLDMASIDEIEEISIQAGLLVGAVAQHRFASDVKTLRHLVQAATLGPVRHVEVEIQRFRSPAFFQSAYWRRRWDLAGGGVLMTVGFHYLDLACWIAGPPADARAVLRESIGGVDSFISGCFRLGSSTATITARWGQVDGRADFMRIICEQGTFELTGDRLVEGGSGEVVGREELHVRQLWDFADAVRECRRPSVTPSDVKSALGTIFSMYQSAGCSHE